MVLVLIFLAYPFFSVGISTILCAFGKRILLESYYYLSKAYQGRAFPLPRAPLRCVAISRLHCTDRMRFLASRAGVFDGIVRTYTDAKCPPNQSSDTAGTSMR